MATPSMIEVKMMPSEIRFDNASNGLLRIGWMIGVQTDAHLRRRYIAK